VWASRHSSQASYYQGATQIFTFELERRGYQAKSVEVLASWETGTATLEEQREGDGEVARGEWGRRMVINR
jgi:hypothetical protein